MYARLHIPRDRWAGARLAQAQRSNPGQPITAVLPEGMRDRVLAANPQLSNPDGTPRSVGEVYAQLGQALTRRVGGGQQVAAATPTVMSDAPG
ncbi:hypothetical protein M0638_14810, partial [Roseomonas sp. NAR14]